MIARSFLLFVGIAIGGVAVHYYDRAAWQKAQEAIVAEQQSTIRQAVAQSEVNTQALQQRIDELEVKALLDQSMIDRYTKENTKLHDELSGVKRDLEFYEQFLPSGPSGGVSIRSLDMVFEGAMLSYKLLLSRQKNGEAFFNGRLQFLAKGKLNGQVETVELVPAVMNTENTLAVPSDSSDAQKLLKDKDTNTILSLQFERWQQAKGNLVLPTGFEPEEVTMNVLEGKHVRASKTVIFEAP